VLIGSATANRSTLKRQVQISDLSFFLQQALKPNTQGYDDICYIHNLQYNWALNGSLSLPFLFLRVLKIVTHLTLHIKYIINESGEIKYERI